MRTTSSMTRLAPWAALCALSFLAFPATAADQDGDGITDAVETAVGLDPETAEFGAVYQLTPADDYNRYSVKAVEDADGNFHVAFVRTTPGAQWRSVAPPHEVAYMMVSADGEILIDETVVNPLNTGSAIRMVDIQLDADGKVVLAWVHYSVNSLRITRLDPSLAPQDGTAATLATIEDLADMQVDASDQWKNLEFGILADGDFIFWNLEGGRMLRTDSAGAAVALADASTNPRDTDTNWSKKGHGFDLGFVDELGFHVVGQYCDPNPGSEASDCPPAYALYDVDTFEFLVRPTPLQVSDFRKAHGSHYSIGTDADGLVYVTWNDRRGSFDSEYCGSCYSQGSSWFMRFDPEKFPRNGGLADFSSAGDGEVRLGGRHYMQSFTDPAGVTHVLYWDALGFDYQTVSPQGVASGIVSMSETASRPTSWRKHMNARLAGTTLFYAETDTAQDTTDTAGAYGLRVMMRPLGSVSAIAGGGKAKASEGSVAFFETLPQAELPSTDGVPENISLTDSNYRLIVTGLDAGESVTLTVDTGGALPENWRVLKYNGAAWMEIAGTAVGESAFAFEVTDGGVGDADGEANGMIVDPVGIGIYTPKPISEPVQASGGGGGCVIGNGGSMDPVFPIMLLLAGAWLLRRRLNRAAMAAAVLALFTVPAQAADQDGDGIADDVEIAIGLDPAVSNSGAVQLTPATDALRFRPSVATDADGNYHLAFVRFNKDTSINSADYTDVVYMMVSPSGEVLIKETVINTDPANADASTTNVLIDDDGNVNVIWADNNYLKMARLDPSAAEQDGSAGDVADPEFLLFGETDVDNNNSIYYIIYSHIAANGDFIVASHHDMDVTRFSVDDAGVVTPVYTAVNNLTDVQNAGHTSRQVAFDADDNLHVIFQDGGSATPLMDNDPIVYAVISGADGSILSDATPVVTGYTTPPHGVFGSVNLGSDGMLYTVWGDKRGTLDENNYCDFCSSRGTAWFTVLDPSAANTDGAVTDMTAVKAMDDVQLATRWYISAFLDADNNTHVFFNESMHLDHMLVDPEGNVLSNISLISTATNTPNNYYRQSGNVVMADDVAFFTMAGTTTKAQAGSGLFMKHLGVSASAGDASVKASGGRVGFLESVADADLPDADTLPENVELTGANYRLVVEGVKEGGAATVTIDTGAALPEDMRVFKYDGAAWKEFQFNVAGDNAFSITLVDGGAGDADGAANGMIVDPVAVTRFVKPEPTVAKGDGGGCVIGKGGAFDPLFPGMLLLAGLYLLRRRVTLKVTRAAALAVAGGLAVVAPVQAEEQEPAPAQEEGTDYFADSKSFFTTNTYVGITLGTPGSDASESDIANLDSVVSVNSISIDDGGTGYRLFFGKQLHDRVAVEIGFVDLGDIDVEADVEATDTNAFLNDLANVAPVAPTGFTVDAFGNYPVGANFSVIGRLGLFFWNTDVEFGDFQSSDDGVDLHYGLGAAYTINEDFDVRLEYEAFQSTTEMDMIGVGVTWKF